MTWYLHRRRWRTGNGGKNAHVTSTTADSISSRCTIRCYALNVNKTPDTLKTALEEVIRILNFIRSTPLIQGSSVHFMTKWVAVTQRCCWIRRFSDYHKAESQFVHSHWFQNSYLGPLPILFLFLLDSVWLQRLLYLAYIFTKINQVEVSSQGTTIIIIISAPEEFQFLLTIECCKTYVETEVIDCSFYVKWVLDWGTIWPSFGRNRTFIRTRSYTLGIFHTRFQWLCNPYALPLAEQDCQQNDARFGKGNRPRQIVLWFSEWPEGYSRIGPIELSHWQLY